MNRLLKIGEVKHRTALSKSTIYKMIRAGTFPRPRIQNLNSVALLETEVDQWISERIYR
jgi:prophage regulatory protein